MIKKNLYKNNNNINYINTKYIIIKNQQNLKIIFDYY